MKGLPSFDRPALRARRTLDSGIALVDGEHCLHLREHPAEEGPNLAAPARLAPVSALFDTWWVASSTEKPVGHVHGCTRVTQIGPWLHATAVIDDTRHPHGLQGAAHEAYTDLFEVLRQARAQHGEAVHVLKVWNYLAQINADDPATGLERYRLFNIGRQDAFLEAGLAAFDGAPAACALGTDTGPLTVHLLAGPHTPEAIENPRQTSAYRYPAHYGPRAPTFSRAALADLGADREMLFISGTASIVGHDTLHAGDVRQQTEETLRNLQAVTDAARERARAVHALPDLELTVYVRHPQDLDTVRAVIHRELGPDSQAARTAVYLRADICRADLLVEIEAQSDATVSS